MTYEQALSFINSRLRFGIKPGLERTEALLQRLGSPQKRLKFVHIAGTNGKGSVCAMVSAGLRSCGMKTGLYTSPYIVDFRERMQINGEMIPKNDLARLTESVGAQLDGIDELTEFELITCIAFMWFAENECDAVVLETGLGGRLDATNVIESPACCAITRIDYDHTAVLGDTISLIAAEKAAIIKRGCPAVVSGNQYPEALEVMESAARDKASKLVVAGRAQTVSRGLSGTEAVYNGMKLRIPLLGEHQLDNAAVAVEVLRILGVPEQSIFQGISSASLPARLEVVSESPLIIVDGAHNPNGAAALASAVDLLLAGKKLTAVMGILADKNYDSMINTLCGKFAKVIACDGYSDRALAADRLSELAGRYAESTAAKSPEAALNMALAEPGDGIIVCGSLYLASRLLGRLRGRLRGEYSARN